MELTANPGVVPKSLALLKCDIERTSGNRFNRRCPLCTIAAGRGQVGWTGPFNHLSCEADPDGLHFSLFDSTGVIAFDLFLVEDLGGWGGLGNVVENLSLVRRDRWERRFD
jgi:hypothetical protein